MARTPTGLNSLKTTPQPSVVSPSIIPVRVKFVSLNGKDYPINWKEYGEYAGVGGILFEEIANPSSNNLESLDFAKPLYSNIKFVNLYPQLSYENKFLKNQYSYDGIHINKSGYSKITHEIYEKLY